jgi:hypothetical protein
MKIYLSFVLFIDLTSRGACMFSNDVCVHIAAIRLRFGNFCAVISVAPFVNTDVHSCSVPIFVCAVCPVVHSKSS